MNIATSSIFRTLAVLAVVGMLSGCGNTGKPHKFEGVAHMKVIQHRHGTAKEEGQIVGAYKGALTLDINLRNGKMLFKARNPEGTFEGTGGVLTYQLGGEIRHFKEAGNVTGGTGVFAHANSHDLTFTTLDDRIHKLITVTVAGTLYY